ncbi:hypothetical protein [Nocardia brevicatena]|uniref:hypothetical protein n=1 Tax=Nocardia brevicatena TaxID=37327 RepID=UPI0002DA06DA|nr:hypothetical protein [Nocardia brevicatena]
MAAMVARILTAAPRTLRGSAEEFLDTIRSPNTRRAYSIAGVETVDQFDGRGPDAEIGAAPETSRAQRLSTPGTPAVLQSGTGRKLCPHGGCAVPGRMAPRRVLGCAAFRRV